MPAARGIFRRLTQPLPVAGAAVTAEMMHKQVPTAAQAMTGAAHADAQSIGVEDPCFPLIVQQRAGGQDGTRQKQTEPSQTLQFLYSW